MARTGEPLDVSPAEGRLRTPRMLLPDAIVSRDDRGRLHVRSPHALGPYPATLTHCLAQWAERAPDCAPSSPRVAATASGIA